MAQAPSGTRLGLKVVECHKHKGEYQSDSNRYKAESHTKVLSSDNQHNDVTWKTLDFLWQIANTTYLHASLLKPSVESLLIPESLQGKYHCLFDPTIPELKRRRHGYPVHWDEIWYILWWILVIKEDSQSCVYLHRIKHVFKTRR